MAGTKVTRNGKLSGSSLLEVVIAMVVIVMVLGIALSIFANVTRSSLSAQQLRAKAVLDHTLISLEQDADTTAADSLIDAGWKLVRDTSAYEGSAQLRQVHLAVLDENRDTLAQLQKVLVVTSKTPAN